MPRLRLMGVGVTAPSGKAGERPTLLEAIQQAENRGWRLLLTIDGTDDFIASAERGDSNCPHAQVYSKSDGHGYESIDEVFLGSLDQVAEWILKLEDFKR